MYGIFLEASARYLDNSISREIDQATQILSRTTVGFFFFFFFFKRFGLKQNFFKTNAAGGDTKTFDGAETTAADSGTVEM